MSADTRRGFLMTDAGDLDVSKVTLQYASGLQAMKQAIRSSIQLFLGEWFLDASLGTAWKQTIFVKGSSLALVKSILRERITRVRGVKTLNALEVSYDPFTRTLSSTFSDTCDFGVFDDTISQAGNQ